ncbi:hypothetical protein AALO_G00264290 [Alosa alosa]|uniref:Uncharacterized protein n=1 Tax=Alosa alosa TaxID=278164 RepID=A0AAV6FNN2_9TELE|nr:hypothetical protein AALO_G00264290 [Alosa alosa]
MDRSSSPTSLPQGLMMSKEAKFIEDTEPANKPTHWVEDLFQPHFRMEDVMKNFEEIRKKTYVSVRDHTLPNCLQSAEGNDTYKKVLQEKQQREEKLLMENLAKRVAAASVSGAASSTKSKASSTIQIQIKQPEQNDCIWNQLDLSTLCETMSKTEKDRRRLRMQLERAQAEVQVERQKRQRLQGLLDECEQQLALSRQEAARWALQLEAQQAEGRAKDTQVQAQATEARQVVEETARWRTAARKGREEMKDAQRKCADLMWELERLKEHHKVEEKRLVEATRLEDNVILQKVTQELEETRAKLEAEKANHSRSQTALELLRKHFTKQSG